MNVETKAKLLQYFIHKNDEYGFAKIGLLVRIFLYSSVVAVVSVPYYIRPGCCRHNFLSQCNCAKNSEAKQIMGTTNRAQQAYFLENGMFTDSWEKLGIGIKTESYNYKYRILFPMVPVHTLKKTGDSVPFSESIIAIAHPKQPQLKTYIGATFTIKEKGSNERVTLSALCESTNLSPSPLPSTLPTLSNGETQCPEGTTQIK